MNQSLKQPSGFSVRPQPIISSPAQDLVQKTEGQKMTVLDIGSGLGYASTALASRGIQSIAIDASPTNQQLFLRTLCHNEVGLSP